MWLCLCLTTHQHWPTDHDGLIAKKTPWTPTLHEYNTTHTFRYRMCGPPSPHCVVDKWHEVICQLYSVPIYLSIYRNIFYRLLSFRYNIYMYRNQINSTWFDSTQINSHAGFLSFFHCRKVLNAVIFTAFVESKKVLKILIIYEIGDTV